MTEFPPSSTSLPRSIHKLLQTRTHATNADVDRVAAPTATPVGQDAECLETAAPGPAWPALEQLIRLMTDCAGSRMSVRRTFAINTILQDLCESDGLPDAFREALTELSDEWANLHQALLRCYA